METNVIDLILIFSIVISGSLALFQGFFKELLALLGWVVAFVNIKVFFVHLSKPLVIFIENDALRDIVVISTIFIHTLIIWRVISIPIQKILKSDFYLPQAKIIKKKLIYFIKDLRILT